MVGTPSIYSHSTPANMRPAMLAIPIMDTRKDASCFATPQCTACSGSMVRTLECAEVKNNEIEESIPVGCIPPTLYRSGGGVSLVRDPLDREPPWTETPWTETPLDRDLHGQRTPPRPRPPPKQEHGTRQLDRK